MSPDSGLCLLSKSKYCAVCSLEVLCRVLAQSTLKGLAHSGWQVPSNGLGCVCVSRACPRVVDAFMYSTMALWCGRRLHARHTDLSQRLGTKTWRRRLYRPTLFLFLLCLNGVGTTHIATHIATRVATHRQRRQ